MCATTAWAARGPVPGGRAPPPRQRCSSASPATLPSNFLRQDGWFWRSVLVNGLNDGQGEEGNVPLSYCPVLVGLEMCPSPLGQTDSLLAVHLRSRMELPVTVPACFKTCAGSHCGEKLHLL